MEVISNGFLILVGSVAIAAFIMGTFGGAIVWKVRGGLALGGLSTVGVYLLASAAILGYPWLIAALIFGVPSLILTFLISFIVARHFESRANSHHIFPALAAIFTALVAGFLLLVLFRFNLWAATLTTLGIDAYLILYVIRKQSLLSQ